MTPDLNLWQFILKNIEQSKPVILLLVLESKGSSPGRQGFKMVVTRDNIIGSIGGGIMEHKFVEMAKMKLRTIGDEPLIRKQIHSKSAKMNQSGMICSGEQTIALLYLTKKYFIVIEKILNCLLKNQSGLLKITPEIITFLENKEGFDYFFEMKSECEWEYKENIGYKNHLYIIGGGHCALALSKLMSTMDFNIHLFDDRMHLNTFDQNTFTVEKQIISDYTNLIDLIPSGNNIYTVIMTFGYKTDDIALRALIEKDFKYLGILGSQSKMEKMFEEWRKDKLPEEKLAKIFAPVGIPINSQTPDEIAISIAAEIISVKNRI